MFQERMKTKIEKMVIDHVTFHIPKGKIVGVIGGAEDEKRFLLKMMIGGLLPDEGNVYINGKNVARHQKEIGTYTTTVFATISNMLDEATLDTCLYITKKMYHLSKEFNQRQREMLNFYLGTDSILNKTKEEMSLGESARSNLAISLLPNPKLLILEEPFLGIDVVYRQKAIKCIKKLVHETGMTVVLATSQMADIKKLCDRVLVLNRGKKQYYGTVDYLEAKYLYHREIVFEIMNRFPDFEDLLIEHVTLTNQQVHVQYDSRRISAKTIIDHVLNQCNVKNINVNELSLDEALIRLQGGREDG